MQFLAASRLAAFVSTPALPAQQAAASIDPPTGARSVFKARGDGVQIYACTDSPDGLKWVLKAPDAKLLDKSGKTIGKHFAGPTWSLDDGSEVQGKRIAAKPAAKPNAIDWLLLAAKEGSGKGKLAEIKFIQRTKTHGGVAAPSGCQGPGDAGKLSKIPYTATYTFYAEK